MSAITVNVPDGDVVAPMELEKNLDADELPPMSLPELATKCRKALTTFHGKVRRLEVMKLVDVDGPVGGGDMGWVSGASAAAYISTNLVVRAARRANKK